MNKSYLGKSVLPVCSFVLPVFAGVRVDNVSSQTLKSAAEGQVLPKIHLVTKRRSILGLDTNVTQQRLKNNLYRQSQDTHTNRMRGGNNICMVINK